MKLIQFLFICVLMMSVICFLKKSKEKGQLEVKSSQQYSLDEYSQSISERIIQYWNQYNLSLTWLDSLAHIAQQECLSVIDQNDFGVHARFPDWASLVPNKFLTEISFNIEISYFNYEPAEFAEKIYNTIQEQQPFYLSHNEDFIGVHMEQWPSNPSEYTLIIFLLKKPQFYSSCKDSLFFNEHLYSVTLETKNGQTFDVECDPETDEGGWTLIGEMHQKMYSDGTVNINDLGINYSQLLWVAEPDYYMDLNNEWSHDWDFSGWNLEINMFKFDGKWYVSQQTPKHNNVPQGAIRGSGFAEIEDQIGYFDINTDINMLEEASECNIRAVQIDGFCAAKFIMKNLPGRIEALSDVESVAQVSNSDNNYNMNFKLYVR